MCPLCNIKENIIFEDGFLKIVLVKEIDGYVRVIPHKHIRELSELSDKELISLTLLIKKIEKIMLNTLNPDKINVASLGNMVAHLHIHIIPRFKNDPWWPGAIFCKETTFNHLPKKKLKKFISQIKSLNAK